jgi:c-di-GMP-binding flagellar brake protein YcgR
VRRLDGGQEVSLEVESRETHLTCLVVTVEGNEAVLDPLYKARAASVSVEGSHALLTFEHRGRTVALSGNVRWQEEVLVFGVADKVMVRQRRKHARVPAELLIVLTPLDAKGCPCGKPVETCTRDLSAGGVQVCACISAGVPCLRIAMPLPDDEPQPVECDAKVVRRTDWSSGLEYRGLAEQTRERLKRFVAKRQRERVDQARMDLVLSGRHRQGQSATRGGRSFVSVAPSSVDN